MRIGKKAAKPPTTEQREPNDAETPAFPLFFTSPRIISLDRHSKAKLKNDITMAFARKTNSIPLTAADIPEAAKHYPIAFTGTDPILPVALVGLEQENYYVEPQGKWREGCYIPAYVRKYPFVFMEVPESDQLTLCIDEAAMIFDAGAEGKPLYEDGQASAMTRNALEFCVAYQEQDRLAREFCDQLKQKGMLLPKRSDIELANGRKMQLAGFNLLDPEKLPTLSDAEALDWFKLGTLALVYYVLQSQSNWQRLVDLANQKAPLPRGNQATSGPF